MLWGGRPGDRYFGSRDDQLEEWIAVLSRAALTPWPPTRRVCDVPIFDVRGDMLSSGFTILVETSTVDAWAGPKERGPALDMEVPDA